MWALALFGVVLLLQSYFYLFLFRKFLSFNQETSGGSTPFVSVIICARNEEVFLKENLPLVMEQDYPAYEILLIDDGSTDQSGQIMRTFQKKQEASHNKIRIISIHPSESKGKKKALSRGIKEAKGEVLLLTDADCRPASENWIRRMIQGLPQDRGLVLGYGPYKKYKGSFLNKLIRFETLITAIQYFSFALNGKAYMGVGRNLAYHKELFYRTDGFKSHEKIRSGDDDLFVSEVSSVARVGISTTPESFTYSEPKKELKTWIRQKQRHITTSGHYRRYHQLSLGLFYLSQLGFYVLGLILLAEWRYPILVSALIAWRFILFYAVIRSSATRLKEKDLVTMAPLYEFSIIFMQLYIFLKNSVAPPKQW